MKRRPAPHHVRKRANPHPSYEWRDVEDFDGRLVEFKYFRLSEKSPSFLAHRMKRRLRTPYGRAMQQLRQESIEATIRAMEELADMTPRHQQQPIQLLVGQQTLQAMITDRRNPWQVRETDLPRDLRHHGHHGRSDAC